MTSIGWAEDVRRPLGRRDLPAGTRTAARVAILLALVVAAFHYSLWSLLQTLGLDTPLAYVGLVPLIALLLAAARAHPEKIEPDIHDRQVDYIVGLPLLSIALAINLALPRHFSTMFWVWRIDLLSMPFFVAGAVSILFGVRVMWRQRLAIGFLFLAWPLIYEVLLLRFLADFTNMTLAALRGVLHVIRVARPVAGSDGSLFRVGHRPPFQVSVVSACSGVNGMVGFLLVGAALGAVVRGPRIRKAVWLGGGMLFLWAINMVRLVFILWAGAHWGQKVALNVLHPFVGLITFNIGIVVLLFVLRPLGLSVAEPLERVARLFRRRKADEQQRSRTRMLGAPLAVVCAVGLVLTVMNSGLRSFDLVANAVGSPRLASFSDYPASPQGWRARLSGRFVWATPFFGEGSSWLRYTMNEVANAPLMSSQPVIADVISTSNLRTFSAYGVEACYRFHGYKLKDVASVTLGAGINGQALSYYNAKDLTDWTVVYWIWPVRTTQGTRYERVTLYMLNTTGLTVRAPQGPAGITSLRGGLQGNDPLVQRLAEVRSFLVQFGRAIVEDQAAVPVGAKLPPWRFLVRPHPILSAPAHAK